MSKARLGITIPALSHLHSDLPAGMFDAAFRAATKRIDRFIGALAVETAAACQLAAGPQPSAQELLAQRGWVASSRWPLQWVFETLELFGQADRTASGWVLAPVAGESSTKLRAIGEAAEPATRPAYAMMALAAEAMPRILRGEIRGEDVLFGPATMALWFEYLANTNPHYALNNTITAHALSSRLPTGARILEVGGGCGGAAEAVLHALAATGANPAEYVFTDVHPAFLRRGGRVIQQSLPPGCTLRSARADVNFEYDTQGFEARSFDAVVAVNTLHLGHDLTATLARLRRVLKPGGWLAMGELMRPGPDAGVHIELPFSLLEAYGDVALDDGVRIRPGFVPTEGWMTGLERAGFGDAALFPARLSECMVAYAGFYCGTIIARA